MRKKYFVLMLVLLSMSLSSEAASSRITPQEREFGRKAITDTAHLWFFYASDCPYCHMQLPVIKKISAKYGIKVLGVSVNSEVLAGAENFETVFDKNQQTMRMFNIQVTPAIVMVTDRYKPSGEPAMVVIAQGHHTEQELENNMIIGVLAAMRNNNFNPDKSKQSFNLSVWKETSNEANQDE